MRTVWRSYINTHLKFNDIQGLLRTEMAANENVRHAEHSAVKGSTRPTFSLVAIWGLSGILILIFSSHSMVFNAYCALKWPTGIQYR
jgi:hypothetical protein